jgi:hypothetical protein
LSPRPDRTGDKLAGRGIAYAQRSSAVVAIVAEVEIDRRTGKIWRKLTVAHDCGVIINSDGAPWLAVDQERPSVARPGRALRFIEKGCSRSRLPVISLGCR